MISATDIKPMIDSVTFHHVTMALFGKEFRKIEDNFIFIDTK